MNEIIKGKPATLADKVLQIAINEIGKCEQPKGSNWGEDVKKYLASVGITFPASWCMSFVYWCTNEASKAQGVKNPLFKTGGVLMQWNKIPASMKHTTPQVGDIFIMDFGSGHGHTGFVTHVANGRIQTVEGNSNDEGSREGYEVCRKPGGRTIASCKGFIRLS